MKVFLTIFLSLFLTKGCQDYKDLEKVKLVYEANNRGYHKTIIIENKTFSVINVRDTKAVKVTLTDNEWKEIADLFKKVDLVNYNKLKGPTSERFYDGKPHANLLITKDGVEYSTLGFDHTIPPTQIKALVNKIITFSEKK